MSKLNDALDSWITEKTPYREKCAFIDGFSAATKKNPPETAPKDRRILVELDSDFFCVTWVQNPETDDEAWALAQLKNGDRILIRKIDCWYELPGGE